MVIWHVTTASDWMKSNKTKYPVVRMRHLRHEKGIGAEMCGLQLFLGSLRGTCLSASNCPRGLFESLLGPIPLSLLKWLMDHLRKARYRSLSRRTAVTKKSHSVCRVRYCKLGRFKCNSFAFRIKWWIYLQHKVVYLGLNLREICHLPLSHQPVTHSCPVVLS